MGAGMFRVHNDDDDDDDDDAYGNEGFHCVH